MFTQLEIYKITIAQPLNRDQRRLTENFSYCNLKKEKKKKVKTEGIGYECRCQENRRIQAI